MARYSQHDAPVPPEWGMEQTKATWKVIVPPEKRPTKKMDNYTTGNISLTTLLDTGEVALIDGDNKKITDKLSIHGSYWPPQFTIMTGDTLEPLKIVSTRGHRPLERAQHPARHPLTTPEETLMKHRMQIVLGLMALGFGAAAPALASPEKAMTKAGCVACYACYRKVGGPTFKDIAAKYHDATSQDLVSTLTQRVRTGGKGVCGPIPMPPRGPGKIADADFKAAIELILKS